MSHSTTGIAPCMLMFGRPLSLPADLEFGAPFHDTVQQCSGEYARNLRQTLYKLHEWTRRTVRDATLRTKRRYDLKATPVDLRPNDIVWLHNPKKRRGYSRKLQTQWEGPYIVVKRLTDVVVQIRKSRSSRIKTVHADRLRLVKRPETPTEPAPTPRQRVLSDKVLSANLLGIRGRKPNARCVFPLLRVKTEVLNSEEERSLQSLSDKFKDAKTPRRTFPTINVSIFPGTDGLRRVDSRQVLPEWPPLAIDKPQSQSQTRNVRRGQPLGPVRQVKLMNNQLQMVIPNPTSRCLTHRVIRKKLAISSMEHLSLPSQAAPECDAQGMHISVTRKRCIPTRSSEQEVPTKRRKSGAKRGTRGARAGEDKKRMMPTDMQESI